MEAASVLIKSASLLIQILGSPITKEIKSIWKYEADIKRLADTVGFIGDVLSDVEAGRQFHGASVRNGYKRLREAFLDAEDFLDAVETHKKKQEAIATKLNKEKEEMLNKANGKRKLLLAHARIKKKAILVKTRRFFSSSAKHAIRVHRAIKKIRKNLDDIATDLHKFQLSFTSEASDCTTIRATGPCVDANKMIGRERDQRKIIELLLRSSTDPMNVPVTSIVGMGGMGKTTTAQLLYNDKSWQESCRFDLKLWIPDSKKFDVKSLLKNILKITNPGDSSLDTLDENHLRERLVKNIGGKRFLLVLDDVENEDHLIWEQLQDLLNHGNKKDSRILVTTRSKEVARIMGSDSPYELRGLSETGALQLFERYAFRGRRDENLVEIGKLVVKKCFGVPLAIKVTGSLLCGKDQHMWERVRDTDLAMKDESNQLIPILKMSYYNLDSTLKQCFSYCALFPKNFDITKRILSSIWRANVRFKHESETLEDDCKKNLKILCDRCLLEEVQWKFEDGCFKMHDLIHDLANEVAGEEMFVVNSNAEVSNKLILEENVRHVSIFPEIIKADGPSTLEVKGRRLRTFLNITEPYSFHSKDVTLTVDELVLDCPVLRLLDMHSWGVKRLPNSIGKLIHLRHLDLSGNKFETLPDSIIELINLRHLNLSKCSALTHLPSGMDALASLEVLQMSNCIKLEELPTGIEKLINLRRVDLSWLMAYSSFMLSIMGAFSSLEVLNISGCVKFEEQLMGIEKLVKLRHLRLVGCRSLTHMPPEMGVLASLEVLNMSKCEKLVELPVSIEKLIKLRHLNLSYCKALTHLPSGMGALTSLEVLDMSNCDKLVELPVSIEKLIKLRHVNLSYCKTLTHLPSGMGVLTSLEVLITSFCDKLKELPMGCKALIHLPSGEVSHFIVGDSESMHTAQLEELDRLSESIGEKLIIELSNNMVLKESWDGKTFLLNKERLLSLEIKWQDNPKEEVPRNHMEILAKLQPPPSLTNFRLHGYQGNPFPLWFPSEGFASVLPNLMEVCISNCGNCKHLPPLSGLRRLTCLTLCGLSNLEYIEENISAASFCPLLECLQLNNLPKLKGWVDDDGEHEKSLMLPSFPHLSGLRIRSCPNLTVVPLLVSFVKVFSIKSHAEREETSSSPTPPPLSSSSVGLFVQVCSNGGGFALRDFNHSLILVISDWNAPDSPSIHVDKSFREMSKHLQTLKISNCSGLKTLSTGVQHLTALLFLEIKQCRGFTGEEDGQVSWKELQGLRYLTLIELPNMVRLPEGIQLITSLQELKIRHCNNLLLPEWLHTTFNHKLHSSGDSTFSSLEDR